MGMALMNDNRLLPGSWNREQGAFVAEMASSRAAGLWPGHSVKATASASYETSASWL